MKLSFMTFACPDWPLNTIIAAAREYGYHGVEFRCDARQRHGVEIYATEDERKEIRTLLESAEISPCCLATGLQFISDNVLFDTLPRIELAADIGCPGLRVLCGPKPLDMPDHDAFNRVVDHLHKAADQASQLGVELWLETHDTTAKAADAAAIVREVNHFALGINYDILHPFRMNEPLEQSIASMGEFIKHVHFHDGMIDPQSVIIKPFGQGNLPLDDIFRALVNVGYDGYLSGEWFHETYGQTAQASLARFRDDVFSLAERNNIRLG